MKSLLTVGDLLGIQNRKDILETIDRRLGELSKLIGTKEFLKYEDQMDDLLSKRFELTQETK